MSDKTVKRSPSLSSGAWYETRLEAQSLDGEREFGVIVPGASGEDPRSLTVGEDRIEAAFLSRYSNRAEVGVYADEYDVRFDDVELRPYPGRHLVAPEGVEPETVEVSGRDALDLADACVELGAPADAEDFAAAERFTAFFVLQRAVASFDDWATVLFFGGSDSNNWLSALEVNEDGALRVRAKVAGGAITGRVTADGALPNSATRVIAVSVDGGVAKVYLTNAAISTSAIGTGAGHTPRGLVDWETGTPRVLLGASLDDDLEIVTSPGCPRLLRLQYADVGHVADESRILKQLKKLRGEFGV